MKKALVLFLAVAMVFSFAATAMAFSDIADEKSTTQDAINLFAAQGLLTGYPDGTFLPNGTITRAEMAAVVIRYTGNTILADSLKNVPSEFTDVKTGEWYTGYVNAAVALGYFQGMGDGTFGVSANLTYGQIVTVALRLAGYNDNLAGSWPYDYVAQASKAETPLVKAAEAFDAAAAATRKDVILIFDALLDVKVVSYNEKGVGAAMFPVAEGDKNVLDTYKAFDAGNAYEGVAFDNTKKVLTIGDKALADNFAVSDGYTLVDLILGEYDGVYYVNGDGKVCYVDLDGAYAKGFVTAFTAATETKAGSVTVGGVEYVIPADNDATATKGAYVNVTLVDGKIATIAAVEADFAGSVVTKLATDGKSYEVAKLTSEAPASVVIAANNADFVVIKDGALAAVADIKVGDLVYAATIDGVEYAYVVVSPVGEAAITALTGSDATTIASYVINGVTYTGDLYIKKGDAAFKPFEMEDYTDKDASIKNVAGIFYADANGYAVAMTYGKVEEAKTTDVYGFIMDGTLVTGVDATAGLGSVGDTVVLGYSDLTLYTTAGENVKYAVKDNGYKKDVTAIFDISGKTFVELDGETVAKGLFVKATLNEENVITALELVDYAAALETIDVDKKYSTLTVDGKLYNLAADVPVFNVTLKDEEFNKVAVVKAGTVLDVLDNESAYVVFTKAGAIDFIVLEDLAASQVVNKNYVVLESLFAEGDKVTFYGDETLYAKATGFNADGAAKGDIVTYTLTSGKVSALDLVSKFDVFKDAAAKVGSVAGAVVNLVNAEGDANTNGGVVTTGGEADDAANFIISDKTVVLIYTGTNGVAEEFSAVGTAADIVKGAYVVGLDLDSDDVAREIVIVVK